MRSIEEIRDSYIDELLALQPELEDWWDDLIANEGQVVWKRWPTGIAGHPRVLAIFRKHYLEIVDWNDAQRLEGEEPEEKWGIDSVGKSRSFEWPIEILIINVRHFAPQLQPIIDGLCFVPMAMNLEDEVA
jgi:hypothetical protein